MGHNCCCTVTSSGTLGAEVKSCIYIFFCTCIQHSPTSPGSYLLGTAAECKFNPTGLSQVSEVVHHVTNYCAFLCGLITVIFQHSYLGWNLQSTDSHSLPPDCGEKYSLVHSLLQLVAFFWQLRVCTTWISLWTLAINTTRYQESIHYFVTS